MKKTPGIIILMVILAINLFSLNGCTFNREEPANKQRQAIPTYNVGFSGTFPPFGFVGKDGNPQGFELDLLEAIAAAEGVKFNYEITSWSGMMPALKSQHVDILMCSMTITDERKKEVDFSDPYFESTNYMLVPVESKVQSLSDLKGKTVAVLQASTSDFVVSDLFGKNYEGIKRFNKTTTAFMELRNRKVDAALGDSGIVMHYVKSNPEAELKVIEETGSASEYYGMAVRKGDRELAELLNKGLKRIREKGEYDQIYQKWFNN